MYVDDSRGDHWIFAANEAEVRERKSFVCRLEGNAIALFPDGAKIFAVDNRCPHLGFPLDRGSVQDCILTCHWHQARFDLTSGGTFDQWADDVRAFPVRVQNGEIWINLAELQDPKIRHVKRLQQGLERDVSLVIAKSVVSLHHLEAPPVDAFRTGLEFGVRNRRAGWGQGLTIHTALMNIAPLLDDEDRPRAMFHGIAAVSSETAGSASRFPLAPLSGSNVDFPTLKRWFRQFIQVRDSDGSERCLATAIRNGGSKSEIAEMLFSALTDHRYIQFGHPLDFTNKAFEALEYVGWEQAEKVLTCLVPGITTAGRMEEANSWRNPVDLILLLEEVFLKLPVAILAGKSCTLPWEGKSKLVEILMSDDPFETSEALISALSMGLPPHELAGIVAYCAALRISRFHTSNEFGDWDRALHTFTFANAVHQGLSRTPCDELVRGVFDAAMSLYLDRFLNVPQARLIKCEGEEIGEALLSRLQEMLNQQQQVNESGGLVSRYLDSGSSTDALLACIGKLLLREDRDFHTIQMIEAAFSQFRLLRGAPEGIEILVGAVRYLSAHSPTMRSQGQTYDAARRLQRGERIFEEK